MRILGKIIVLRLISYAHTESHKPFFLRFNLAHKLGLQVLNVQHNFYSVICYTTTMNTDFTDFRK